VDAILEKRPEINNMNRLKINLILVNLMVVLVLLASNAKAERIKDMAAVDSMRDNRLLGMV